MPHYLPRFQQLCPDVQVINVNDLCLLGSPILPQAGAKVLTEKLEDLERLLANLQKIDAHPALFLLQNALAIPKVMYFLRTSPTWKNVDILEKFDESLRSGLEKILNQKIDDRTWTQHSLPISLGGLGIRKTIDLAVPAFLSSANATAYASNALLPTILDYSFSIEADSLWRERMGENAELSYPKDNTIQEQFDRPVCEMVLKQLIDSSPSESERAVLLAVSSEHSSEWLKAVPVSSLGFKLDSASLKIAVGLRSSTRFCSPYRCVCGRQVDPYGRHGLSCKVAQGRHPRHSEGNNIIHRALALCDLPSTLEIKHLCRSDNKRPDGMTHFSYKNGLPLVWDFTLCASHISDSIQKAGKAADKAEDGKLRKYDELKADYYVVPVGVETFGSWGSKAKKFLEEVGNLLIEKTDEKRAKHYLFQRLSMAIVRGNVSSVKGTTGNIDKLNEIFNFN